MLAVGVDPAAVRIAARDGLFVAGGDRGSKATVHAERVNLGPVRACDLGRPVGGAVVDDEDVDLGKLAVELVEDRGEVLLLVPGREEDEGVRHARSSAPNRAASASTMRSRRIRASSSESVRSGDWNET
jgi:hypothetical protein